LMPCRSSSDVRSPVRYAIRPPLPLSSMHGSNIGSKWRPV
jgi:hypothetical protein